MKITASRKDDLLRQRDEYDATTNEMRDRAKKQEEDWREVIYDQQGELEKRISEMIGSTPLNLEIRVDPWGYHGAKYWGVDVKAHESDKFDDRTALSWNWEVKMDNNGNIVKDSGSWSGLKAITADQIADLEESVRILKTLNNMDWNTILTSPKAEWEDYIDHNLGLEIRDRKTNRPDFESQIQAEELQELIGGNVALQLKQDSYWRGEVWILPTGLTDKFIKGYIFPMYTAVHNNMNADEVRVSIGEQRRSSRSNLVVKNGEYVTLDLG